MGSKVTDYSFNKKDNRHFLFVTTDTPGVKLDVVALGQLHTQQQVH
jgi:hypothetical protein